MPIVMKYKKSTLVDRFRAAYYAFTMEHSPDMQVVLDQLSAERKKEEAKLAARQLVVDKLDPYAKAIVTSVAAATANWRQHTATLISDLDAMPVDEQIVVIKHINKTNKEFVRQQEVATWSRRNINSIFDNLAE